MARDLFTNELSFLEQSGKIKQGRVKNIWRMAAEQLVPSHGCERCSIVTSGY